MKPKRSPILILLIALLCTAAVPAYSAEPVQELKLGISKDENWLNPYTYVTGSPGLDLVNLIYDTLFVLDESNKPIPWLVKDFSVSDDGKQYKLILHENVKWQDGKPLTSEDVKFTYEYLVTHKKSRFTKPVKAIKNIQTPDAATVIMELIQPEPDFFIQPLADLPILPKHIWSNISNPDQSTEHLGSGPYLLEEYKQGQYYKFKSNPDYFKGKPPIESMVLPIIEDPTALFTALKAGQLDAVSRTVSPELAKEFDNNPNIKLMRGPGFSTTMLQFNAEKFPLTDVKMRQAISLAIDPQYLVDTVLLGYGASGNPGFIHPDSPYNNKAVTHKTDLEKAKSTLEQAGYKDIDNDGMREAPDGKKIELVNLVYSNSPTRIRTAEIISEWMKGIGLNVKVRPMDSTTVDSLVWPEFDVTKGRNYDMAIWSWSSTMQLFPARITELFHSNLEIGTTNIGAFKSKEFDKLADQLKVTLKPEERSQIINKMQEQIAAENPIVPLYYEEVTNAFNPGKYGGWLFQDGKGIINKLSFITSDTTKAAANQSASPTANVSNSNQSEPAKSTSTGQEQPNANTGKGSSALITLLVILVAIAGGGYWLRRTKTQNKNKNL
ncbi:ABC transporter substrate-binding protein [Brevibacillus centrosporus]|uniref:ABC transporter substrate-binding protein n=1 Tax=Brevibacillus centrosporus TaxID=54910 RepID=UPI0011442613|nr:ABC transporter substrate-binding protein [Brevibacillus centrosporus]MEC2127826.1 ABC transporter substrate-binding protein [Brevibacillus centrosporus]GED32066.1 DNA-binding protein [Brevibacillus centrosporus]